MKPNECSTYLSIDRDGLMTGFKFSVPWASSVESLLIRVLQAIVNKDHRKRSKYLSQKDVGDLLCGHGTRTLQVPAVWSGIAEPQGDGLERFSNFRMGQHISAYVDA